MREPARKRLRVARLDQEAGAAILYGILDAADALAGDRHAARHGLDRRDSERFVPRHRDEHVGGAVEIAQHVAWTLADEQDVVRDALFDGNARQAPDLRRQRGIGRTRFAADDDEQRTQVVPALDERERADHRFDALARNHAAELQHDRPVGRKPETPACLDPVDRRELLGIEAARNHPDP